jgi:hypothetical protein
LPANAYLHFAHAYDFEHESGGSPWYDGGVLEYSINNGSTWQDAGSLMDYNGYRGIIASGYGNPLAGRQGFVGPSHGYISTRLNLSSLAGHSVRFRWRMGLDYVGYSWGWWLDDVHIYTCTTAPVTYHISGNAGIAGATLSYTGGSTTAATDGSYSFTVNSGWNGMVIPSKSGVTFAPDHRYYSNVMIDQVSQNYYPTPVGPPQLSRLYPAEDSQVCQVPQVGVSLYLSDLVRTAGGAFDPSKITLTLDGTDITSAATIFQALTQPASRATILYTPPSDLALGPHQAALTYPSTARSQTYTWSFTVASVLCTTSREERPAAGAPVKAPTVAPASIPEPKSSPSKAPGRAPTIRPRSNRDLRRPM